MVLLRKMTLAEFDVFAEYSIHDYANDLMVNQKMDEATAAEQARNEFAGLLPDRMDTPDHALMVIEADHRPVGMIWYLFEETDGIRHSFLSDFIIAPSERRKGYATAALDEMEKDAACHGCSECRLYVWNGNRSVVNLYRKCGYSTFRQTDAGLYMKKILK